MGQWKAFKKSSGTGWKELEHEAGSGWKALEWEYEDFTTFTEVDVVADRIQKTANHIDYLCKRNEDTYLYKDYGVGHFGDFTHKNKIYLTSIDDSAIFGVWSIANDLDDILGLKNGGKTAVVVFAYGIAGNERIYLREIYSNSEYQDYYTGVTLNTWYYLKYVKSSTSMNVYIYSDSDYSVLVDTLTLTLHGNWSFKYLYGCHSYNDNTDLSANGDIENFDLG